MIYYIESLKHILQYDWAIFADERNDKETPENGLKQKSNALQAALCGKKKKKKRGGKCQTSISLHNVSKQLFFCFVMMHVMRGDRMRSRTENNSGCPTHDVKETCCNHMNKNG